MSAAPRRKPVQHERRAHAQVIRLYRSVAGRVWSLGTTRSRGQRCPHCAHFVPNTDFSTRQTPGVSDLIVFLAASPDHVHPACVVFHEVKAPGGRLSPDQIAFREACLSAGVAHIVGGLDPAIAFLVRTGRARSDSFPHYRLPHAEGC